MSAVLEPPEGPLHLRKKGMLGRSYLRQAVAALTVAVAFACSVTLAQAAPFVYVTNGVSGNVSAIRDRRRGRPIPLEPGDRRCGARGPAALLSLLTARAPTSRHLRRYGLAVRIDPSTGALSPKAPPFVDDAAAGAGAVAVNPDGKSAYVPNIFANTVSQYSIDPSTGALSPKTPATVPAGEGPDGIAVGFATPTLNQCRNGGWKQFGFKSQGRCVAFVVLTRICDALERHGIHLKFCPPTPPNPLRPN